jgi:hypothetical protein
MMNILEALDSPEVFAPLFRKPETWKAWRSFLAALFALPMTDDELPSIASARAAPSPRPPRPRRHG